jgi:hypothetical protein
MSAPGRYSNDRRVIPHGDEGRWIVSRDDQLVEYGVVQRRDPRSWELIPDRFGAFDSTGGNVPGVSDGPFDDVVHALIGDPK